jgi:type IV pilus assembly protein PilW
MSRPRTSGLFQSHQRGLTLIELMVAMLIGLFLTAGMIQLFIGTSRTYRFTEGLSRVQENGRFALDILARDLRMAGFSGCSPSLPVANVLNDSSDWWKDFGTNPTRGYEGSETFPGRANCTSSPCNAGDRIAGTDAIVLLKGGDILYRLAEDHNPASAQFKLQTLHQLEDGRIVMVCDHRQAAILQLTNVNVSNKTIVHNTGTGTPGNCTKGLGLPVTCTATGTAYTYRKDSILVDFQPVAYYIGASEKDPSQRSLYRLQLSFDGSTSAAMTSQELIENVFDMQIDYGEDATNNRQADRYGTVSNWNDVVSVRVELLLRSASDNLTDSPMSLAYRGATFSAPDRRFYQVFATSVGLRNRLP